MFLQFSIIAVIILGVLTFSLLKFKNDNFMNKFIKILTYVLIGAFFVRFIIDKEAIRNTVALSNIIFSSKALTFISLILLWTSYVNVIIIMLRPFFKIDKLDNIIKFFTLPSSFICIALATFLTRGIIGSNAYDLASTKNIIWLISLSIELALVFVLSLIYTLKSKKTKFTLKGVFLSVITIFFMFIFTMPAFIPMAFFGDFPILYSIKSLTPYHRILIYIGIILPFIIYFIFKNADMEIKRFAVLFISLGALLCFSLHFRLNEFLNPVSWPLHLCNTAMYIIVICLIFKWKKLFYFTYFINVLGAFLAMAIPNYSDAYTIFNPNLIVFWVNHWIAFFMPLLIVALGVYERPKLREFIYSVIGFSVYFVIILFVNAWFSNFATVDYFFVNSDFIAEKLGTWAENLRNVTFTFSVGELQFILYPLYQFLFWLVYILASLGMWFIYENGFDIAKKFKDLSLKKKLYHQQQLDLIKILDGKEVDSPMNEKTLDKLVLKNFSKKYGNSSVYAVKDANLEVKAGEIFGFLGPNGAGKSTIIKSIVGIQPITSGSIQVCGYDVEKQSVLAKKQIGFVPDHYALYEKLTGREYVNYIADLYGVEKDVRDERIKYYVNLFELNESFDNQMKTYSHGMKQKITIISALVHNPKVWILDEPLTGLDPNSIFQVKNCMIKHAKEGNIVFFSSHIIDVVEKICDKIAIIKKGNIICTKTLDEINKNEGGLENFYLRTINMNNPLLNENKESEGKE